MLHLQSNFLLQFTKRFALAQKNRLWVAKFVLTVDGHIFRLESPVQFGVGVKKSFSIKYLGEIQGA